MCSNFKLNVKAYICSTHFLKNVIKDTQCCLNNFFKNNEANENLKRKLKSTFILSFALLQNSTNIKYFDEILFCIFCVFSEKYQSRNFLNSLKKLQLEMFERKVNTIIVKCENVEIGEIFTQENTSKCGIKKLSPFTKYFSDLISSFKSIINEQRDDLVFVENPLYCPLLFSIIECKLHIVPLWTGIVVFNDGPISNFNSRITNNPIESYFNILKNSILQVKKNQKMKRRPMPSEYVAKTYRYNLSKYIQFYSNEDKQKQKKLISDEKERWSESLKKNYSREKGYFYKSNQKFGSINLETSLNLDNTPNPEFDEIFYGKT